MKPHYNSSNSVLIETQTQNNSQENSSESLSKTNETNLNDLNGTDGRGWLSKASNGVYNAGAGAVTYGWGGLKWAIGSTASVGSTVLKTSADGVSHLKKRATKDKNE